MTTPPVSRVVRRAVAVIATIVAVTVGLVATAAPSSGALVSGGATPSQSERPTRVLAVGDSVLEGAATAIPAALPGREVLVDTEVSRSTRASAEAGEGHGTDWDVVVILLGHNDGGSPGVYQPPYRRLLDYFADVPSVVVLTIHEVRPYYAEVNQFLRDEAAARSNVHVADWNAAVSPTSGTLAGDGLHLSGQGAQLMAGLIADQVAQAEGGNAPSSTTAPPTTEPSTTGPSTTEPPTSAPSTTATPPTTGASPTTATETGSTPATSTVRRLPTTPASSNDAPSESGGRPDGGGDATSSIIWALLVVATVAAALAVLHVSRRSPT